MRSAKTDLIFSTMNAMMEILGIRQIRMITSMMAAILSAELWWAFILIGTLDLISSTLLTQPTHMLRQELAQGLMQQQTLASSIAETGMIFITLNVTMAIKSQAMVAMQFAKLKKAGLAVMAIQFLKIYVGLSRSL